MREPIHDRELSSEKHETGINAWYQGLNLSLGADTSRSMPLIGESFHDSYQMSLFQMCGEEIWHIQQGQTYRRSAETWFLQNALKMLMVTSSIAMRTAAKILFSAKFSVTSLSESP